ncbi:MAG: hypothetical protein OD918_01280 [Gammaproteobacteria bacterium]
MRIAQRRAVGFNLAFLDIMACGLGAIILLFMLVKDQAKAPSAELEMLQADLSAMRDEARELEDAARALTARIKTLRRDLQGELAGAAESNAAAGDAAGEIIKLAKEIARLEREKARQQQRLGDAGAKTAAGGDEKEHLIGLGVKPDRNRFAVILLNSSATMVDENLAGVTQYVIDGVTGVAKHDTPKWKRALAAVRWIIARIPKGKRYMIVHYNENAHFLNENWRRGGDEAAREEAHAELEALRPRGLLSNLQAALQFITRDHPTLKPEDVTDVYVITDSLPNMGMRGGKAARCDLGHVENALTGEHSQQCRKDLFGNAKDAFRKPRSLWKRTKPAQINVVLLPLEYMPLIPSPERKLVAADQYAAYEYWQWTTDAHGTMVNPDESWP